MRKFPALKCSSREIHSIEAVRVSLLVYEGLRVPESLYSAFLAARMTTSVVWEYPPQEEMFNLSMLVDGPRSFEVTLRSCEGKPEP